MKNLILILPLVAFTLALSNCCNTFGRSYPYAGSHKQTKQVLTGYEVIREEVLVDAKSGLTQVQETRIPQYKTVTETVYQSCPDGPRCTRFYCLNDGCCDSNTDELRKMATSQGGSGSPNIGLAPTMKKIVIE